MIYVIYIYILYTSVEDIDAYLRRNPTFYIILLTGVRFIRQFLTPVVEPVGCVKCFTVSRFPSLAMGGLSNDCPRIDLQIIQ